ncbi:hypothetical protein EDF73_102578 [Raoultella sp. BIGb0138]|uniref:hypothetical protein n=1 Tax=Raoultella sp. BIGb0138 TaxID=2485115 RepID=UPI001045C4C7|nr:hypothetical protein [Raoultella sp. BIGb0138]TCW16767.1 hypothetical protein EDF73_102578 [Raoultella sp. BIGb0138]
MKFKKSKKAHTGSIIFTLFIIMNVVMLAVSMYVLYFSSAAPFAEHRFARDAAFWIGAFKHILFLSGLWIFLDIIFSAYFFFTRK